MCHIHTFLQAILKDVDSLLYVDTDVLFLRPMDDIWSFFKSFNSTQLAAMAPEHESPKIDWYSRFARHPFYGLTGVNSGVMLMNLTRIRSTMFKVRPTKYSVVGGKTGGQWSGEGNLWVLRLAPLSVFLSETQSQHCEWAVIEAF